MQKTLVVASIITFLCFVALSFLIVLEDEDPATISVAAQDMQVNLYRNGNYSNPQTSFLDATERFTVSNQEAKTLIGDDIITVSNDFSFEYQEDGTLYIDQGVGFIQSNQDIQVDAYVNDKPIYILPNSTLMIDTVEEVVYVLNGAVATLENEIAGPNEKLLWAVDKFEKRAWTTEEISENSDLLDLVYLVYNTHILPDTLESLSPELQVLP